MVTLAQFSKKVIFASGHEHTLQYIVENETPQIVSGSGAKEGATRLLGGSRFSTGSMGFAVLAVYTDGSSAVSFHGISKTGNKDLLYHTEVLPADRGLSMKNYPTTFPPTIKAAIYTDREIDKSAIFKTLWGERYRKYYGITGECPYGTIGHLVRRTNPYSYGWGPPVQITSTQT